MPDVDVGEDIDDEEFKRLREAYVDGEIESIGDFERLLEESVGGVGSSPESETSDDEQGDFYDRFENADVARQRSEEKEEEQAEQRQEALELHGKAAELFENRHLDTFTLDRHGAEIEFYRPVDATEANLDSLQDRDLADRLRHASRLLNDFEDRQRNILTAAESQDKSIVELYEESLEGTDLMRQILSAHAVDESFWDPRVWTVIFNKDDRVSEVFQDFFNEGETSNMREQLAMLQKVASGNSSRD